MKLSDLFGPRWKHSDTSIRREAVEQVSPAETDTLVEIATTDPDPQIRLIAVAKIHNLQVLERVAVASQQPQPVIDALHAAMHAIYKDAVLSARSMAQAQDALGRIGNDEVLADIAIETDCPEVRLGVIKRINSLPALCRVAQHNCGREAGEAIVERIEDADALHKLAEHGANKVVRRCARQKLDSREVGHKSDVMERRQAELKKLLGKAETWAESWNFEYIGEKFNEARERWAQLDPKQEHPELARFESLHARFSKRLAEFIARREEESREEEARAAVLDQRTALCDRVDWLMRPVSEEQTFDADAVEQAQRSIQAEWDALPSDPKHADDDLSARFADSQKELARLIRRERQDRASLDRLQVLVDRMEAAAADADSLPGRKTVEHALSDAAKLSFQTAEPTELQARLQAAAASIESRREAADAERHAAEIAPRQAILAEIEAAITNLQGREATEAVKAAQASLKELPRAAGADAKAIESQVRSVANAYFDSRREAAQEREVEWWANLTAKEALIAEAESYDSREDLPELAAAIKDIQARWKDIGHVPREKSDDIWNRFKAANDRNYQRCREFFDQQDEQREASGARKRELIEVAESLMNSTDWGAAAGEIKAAQAEWKELGPARRDQDRELYRRFHEACDTFFERRRVHFEEQDSQRPANTEAKARLVEEAQELVAAQNWRDAEQFRRLQAEWQSLGPAEREQEQALWEAFRAAADSFFAWYDEQRPANLAAKQALITELDALLAETDSPGGDRAVANRLMDLQKQWREIGPAPKKDERALWDDFHGKCDAFFTERKQALAELAEQRQGNAAEKAKLVEQAEALATSTQWRETAGALKDLQRQWQSAGPAPRDEEGQLWKRFQDACDAFFTARRAAYNQRESSELANLQAKEDLCARLEDIVGIKREDEPEPEPELVETGPPTPEELARELTIALQANFTVGTTGQTGGSDNESVREIQARWKEIGPVPHAQDRALWQRYRAALDHYYDNKR